jgi:putative oxidoreductase
MAGSTVLPQSWSPRLLSVLRIVAGLLFMMHGTMKLLAYPAPFPMHLSPFTMLWFAGVIELVGGALVLVGLFTSIAAFVMAGEMAFAYFIGHFPKAFWPVLNGGDAAVLYCFVFLYLAAAGAGPWSVDRWRNAA